jgi:hypothetical protein
MASSATMLNLAITSVADFRDTLAGNLSRVNSRALKIIGARKRPTVRVLGRTSVSLWHEAQRF